MTSLAVVVLAILGVVAAPSRPAPASAEVARPAIGSD
jgi:hypothetical protein